MTVAHVGYPWESTKPRDPPERTARCYFCPSHATAWVGVDIPACAPCVRRAREMRDHTEVLRGSFDGNPPPPIAPAKPREPDAESAFWRKSAP